MQTKPYSLQAPEAIAKEYGGNKQKIAEAAKMGLVDPTAAVLAGMFIDRMRGAQAQEQAPKQTVAQQVFSSPQPALGATPQAAQMAAMQEQYAPRPGARGMDRIPTDPNMMPSAAGGGLVAFADGGRPVDRNALMQERTQLETALVPLRRQKQLGLKNVGPSLDAAEARLAEVNRLLAPGTYSDPKYLEEMSKKAVELGGISGGPIATDAASLEEAYRGGDVDLGKPDLTNITPVDSTKVNKAPTVREQLTTVDSSGTTEALPGDGRDAATSYSGLTAIQNSGPVRTDEVMYGQPRSNAQFDEFTVAQDAVNRDRAKTTTEEVAATISTPTLDKAIENKKDKDFTFTSDVPAATSSLESARDRIKSIMGGAELGENEKAQLEYNQKMKDTLKAEADKDMWASIAEFGFKVAASKSPYLSQAIGEAGADVIPKATAQRKERRKEYQAALDRAAASDVIVNNRKMEQLKASMGLYGDEADREIKTQLALLGERNKFAIADMSRDSQERMQLLDLVTKRDIQEAQNEFTSRENRLSREWNSSEKVLDRALTISEGRKGREFQASEKDKERAWQTVQKEIDKTFTGDQNALNREQQYRIAKMQVNAPTTFDRQVARERAYLKSQNPNMGKEELDKKAQDAVIQSQNMIQNGFKWELWKQDKAHDLAKDASAAFMADFRAQGKYNSFGNDIKAANAFKAQWEKAYIDNIRDVARRVSEGDSGSSSGVESYVDYQ